MWIAGNENAFEYAPGCTGREEEDPKHRMSLELTEVILHTPLFPSTLPVAQPNSFSPALLSSSNAVLSKTLFWVLFEEQSSRACLNNLPPPHSAILSSKSQTVWFMMLFQVWHSFGEHYLIGLASWRFFKLSPMLAKCWEIQREGNQ